MKIFVAVVFASGALFSGFTIPAEVGALHALETRYRSIDHLDGYIEAMSKSTVPLQFFARS